MDITTVAEWPGRMSKMGIRQMRSEVVYTGKRSQDGGFEVYAGERKLDPARAVEVYGAGGPREFGWGYAGGGPRLLATGLLYDFLYGDDELARRLHMEFAAQFVEQWETDALWNLPGKHIENFILQHIAQN